MKNISKVMDSTAWLTILTIVAVCLIIAGFIVPPMGIIDGSVLIGIGELAGFGAIWQVNKAINNNMDAKIKTNKVELEITQSDK